MSLEAKNLTFRYPRRGKRPVLEDVSLTLEPGERLGLSAPSGRGKTPLCRLLAGYQRPTDGQILLDGESLPGADDLAAPRDSPGPPPAAGGLAA